MVAQWTSHLECIQSKLLMAQRPYTMHYCFGSLWVILRIRLVLKRNVQHLALSSQFSSLVSFL